MFFLSSSSIIHMERTKKDLDSKPNTYQLFFLTKFPIIHSSFELICCKILSLFLSSSSNWAEGIGIPFHGHSSLYYMIIIKDTIYLELFSYMIKLDEICHVNDWSMVMIYQNVVQHYPISISSTNQIRFISNKTHFQIGIYSLVIENGHRQ